MKNVLITGASRGIGKELVYEFTKNGYRVFLNYNKSEKEAKEIAGKTGAVLVKADISKGDEVGKTAEFIHNNYGGVDVIVNNAGTLQRVKGGGDWFY